MHPKATAPAKEPCQQSDLTMGSDRDSSSRPRRSRRRPTQEQRFSSYLTFGFQMTVCLGFFLVIYMLVLLMLSPLLSDEASKASHMQRGQALRPVVQPIVEKIKHMPHLPGEIVAEDIAGAVKKKLHDFRQKQGMTDASMMEKASAELQNVRKRRHNVLAEDTDAVAEPALVAPGKRTGFIVLGMHRSGTSMLSGLLVTGSGYNVGGPLIGGSFDNEKGFFERIDVVLQNDEFMKRQRIWWASNMINYNAESALADQKAGSVDFEKGKKALQFLNNPNNAPWLQKDPRMCITLKTWLPLLTSEPAIVFTYRHPLEVAHSLHSREKSISVELGLRMWIVYNMRAIQNSAGLCRVTTSNDSILASPLQEVQRVTEELTTKCGVPAAPRKITQEDVDKFVDPTLEHEKKKKPDDSKPVILEKDGCEIRDYDSTLQEGTVGYEREHKLYVTAMKIHCDFQSGVAYKDGYEWPSLR